MRREYKEVDHRSMSRYKAGSFLLPTKEKKGSKNRCGEISDEEEKER